jgi:bacterial leucyl aminopeptidase
VTGFTNAQNQNRVGVVTDFTDAGINSLLRKCIVEYGKLPFVDMRCGYACSVNFFIFHSKDHASWNRAGYRSAFGFEVGAFSLANKAIHTDRDLITNLDMPRATKFVKFGIGLAVELAKE